MPSPVERREFAKFLKDNDRRIEPALIGAVADALVPRWALKSELPITSDADSGIRVPELSFRRLLGPFNDEGEYNQVVGNAARFLGNGDLSDYMDTGRGNLAFTSGTTQGDSDLEIVVSRLTPALGMYSTLPFGELMEIEFGLEQAECVVPQAVNMAMAHILLGHLD